MLQAVFMNSPLITGCSLQGSKAKHGNNYVHVYLFCCFLKYLVHLRNEIMHLDAITSTQHQGQLSQIKGDILIE